MSRSTSAFLPQGEPPDDVTLPARASLLEAKLWGGLSNLAAPALAKICADPAVAPDDAVTASMALARHHAACGKFEKALEYLALIRTLDPVYRRNARILEIHCLLRLARTNEARALIERTIEVGHPADGCMHASLATVRLLDAGENALSDQAAVRGWLEAMSVPLHAGGHVGIALKDAKRPLDLDNLAPDTPPPVPASMPAKVSVLMAVHNGANVIEYAIRSVLEQSWRNLELVIVDDASTDESWARIQRLAEEDNRIIPVRHKRNTGPYGARNTALENASGDYVVVNDADDWAHPQKIEAQVKHLLRYTNVISNMTFRVRIGSDMRAIPRVDGGHVPVIHNDYSALMLSRERALAMGGWDPVRFSADAEFVERLIAMEGPQAVQRIRGGMPLSFSRWDADNLTTSGATSIWTNRFGARHEYVRQFREWHQSGENLELSRTSQQRPFPVPGISYFPRGKQQNLDVTLVTSPELIDDVVLEQCLKEFRQRKLTVGILPWPQIGTMENPDASRRLAGLSRQHGAVPIVHGDRIKCRLLLVHPPGSVHEVPDHLPELMFRKVVLLTRGSNSNDTGQASKLIEGHFGNAPSSMSMNRLGHLLNRTFIRKRIRRIASWLLRRVKSRR